MIQLAGFRDDCLPIGTKGAWRKHYETYKQENNDDAQKSE
jgi:hypothetical protein